MKTDLSLIELATQIHGRAQRKADYIVTSRQMAADLVPTGDGDDAGLKVVLRLPDNGLPAFDINDHCHGQIAAHLDIPVKYYNRMLREQPELLTSNINTWLGERGSERRMVRTLDGTGRAFLSDKYSRLDDDAFAETVLPVIQSVPGSQVVSASITPTKTHIKFVSNDLVREVKAGDLIRFGIAFSNSEVGAGAIQAAMFTERLICTNGMISSEDVFRSAHVGAGHGSGQIADILKIRDYARDLLTPDRIDRHITQLKELAGIPVHKPVEAVEKLAKAHSLTEGEKNSVLEHLIKGADLSMFGMAQAITRSAEDAADYDRATDLERLGGKMLTLGRAEYRELSMAA